MSRISRRARIYSVLTLVLVAAVSLATFAIMRPFSAQAISPQASAAAGRSHIDDLPSALGLKQRALRQQGLQAKASGQNVGKVYKAAKGQYVQLDFEGEDQIFTLLGEFGTGTPTHNHGALGNINHGGAAGPLHNQIPQPDRNGVDNTTIWTNDFNQQHYQELLYSKTTFPSMANFYLEASSGQYSVNGYVGDWVQVPNNEAAYGSNYCGSIVCTRDIGRFLLDQGNAWYAAQIASGKTAAEIDAFLAQFDVWDRYDYDGDGNFNEPDGYIDHFQSVHAGDGEETGGGAQGENAIWSHRSYANAGFPASAGPTVDGHVVGLGGMPLGSSSYWVGDYTIEPENGGVGVFSHEFGHDLNLPDEYDTSGNTGGAENGTAWWTIMSQGSYGTQNGIDLGSAPIHFNAWDKFQLGWLNYGVASAGEKKSFKLGPAETNTKQLQGLFVVLPDKQITVEVGDPFAGSYFYHSGSGNNLNTSMTRSIALPGSGPIALSFQGRWHIEACWDYAYVEVSTDGGATFHSIPTSASSPENTNGQNDGNGITGTSGTSLVCDQFGTPTWVGVTADLSTFAGQTIQMRFRYETDGAVVGDGFGIDNIAITGLATDDAETDPGWTYNGFSRTTGTTLVPYFNAYVAEFRQYRGYDKALQLGPYNFTDPNGNWVEHFPYQDGLLISYWDSSFADNNVGDHPGGGLILPIDAHPGILHWSNGSTARPRIQSYDATFSLAPTDAITLHDVSTGLTLASPSQPGVSTFDDSKSYWVNGDPGDAPGNNRYQSEWNSVNVPHTGTTIRIKGIDSAGFMQVQVD
jgi:immune inhibitor A